MTRQQSDGGLGLSALVGSGVLAITVDQRPTGGEVYQGVVELDGRSLQDSMLRYFHQSEQVPTGIVAAVRQDVDGWIGSAIIVQAMPGNDGQAAVEREDDWRRAMVLMQSAEDDELLNPTLPVDRLLFRLFHEDGVRVFDELVIRFGCTCDESRVRNVLAQFAADEFETMRGEDGLVHVKCEFCSEVYKFDDAADPRYHSRDGALDESGGRNPGFDNCGCLQPAAGDRRTGDHEQPRADCLGGQ